MILEKLKRFVTICKQIQEKPVKLFYTLDQLDKKYKLPNSYSNDGCYDFDYLTIETNYIYLHGSYRGSNKSYILTNQEYFNSDVTHYEQKLKDRLAEYNQKEKDRKIRDEERERETYLKLKAKYEGD